MKPSCVWGFVCRFRSWFSAEVFGITGHSPAIACWEETVEEIPDTVASTASPATVTPDAKRLMTSSEKSDGASSGV